MSKAFPAVTHVAVTVTDPAISVPWYDQLFGTEAVLDEDTGPFRHVVFAIGGGQLIGLVAVVGGLLCGIFGILGHFWHEGRVTALKQDMVSRGMSADEIQAVVAATPGKAARTRHACRA